ncbi:multicopper oxidase family protein [Streptomyces sp. NPDC002306]
MHTYTRRALLGASVAAVSSGVLAGCSGSDSSSGSVPFAGFGPGHSSFVPKGPKGYVNPSGPEVVAVEKKRGVGPVREYRLTATETSLDLGGRTVRSWAYGDSLPGKEIRVTAGDILSLNLANHLSESTTLHSHGVRMRCDMDGVPNLTQTSIDPGSDFTYRFAVSHPGTYWVHSHSGMQLDRGLYAPFIVDDPREPLSYDKEWVVMLDDWVDGVDGSTPDGVLSQLRGGKGSAMDMDMGMGGSPKDSHAAHTKPVGPSRLLHGSRSEVLRSEGGSIAYPYYLINGRRPQAPTVFRARAKDRIRLRIINASGDTAYRVALGGHEMTVTHTDGYPVEHKKTDALVVGMAERYDVLVTAKDGMFPLVAVAEGKNARALAVLRTDQGKTLPSPSVHPAELNRQIVPARRLRAQEGVALSDRKPDREIRIRLTGTMKNFDWAFDHQPYSLEHRHPIRQGERVRLTLINATSMWHPLHVHGHTFAMTGLNAAGARKDTAYVLPHNKLVVDFDADNPGLWMLHCHNQYHSESGMMTVLGYRT